MLSVTVARAAGGGEARLDSKVTLSCVAGGAERSRFIDECKRTNVHDRRGRFLIHGVFG